MRTKEIIGAGLAMLVLGTIGMSMVSTEASAQRRGVHCVMEKAGRVCLIDATAAQQRQATRRVTFGKPKEKRVTACRPGTRPDGKWYLVSCGKGKLCKARCRVVTVRR